MISYWRWTSTLVVAIFWFFLWQPCGVVGFALFDVFLPLFGVLNVGNVFCDWELVHIIFCVQIMSYTRCLI